MKRKCYFRKIILLIMLFGIESFFTIASNQFIKHDWIFNYHGLFFGEVFVFNAASKLSRSE